MKKHVLSLLLLSMLWGQNSFCQLDHFMIGIWSYDYYNYPWIVPLYQNQIEGNDLYLLSNFKNDYINCINIEYQLIQPSPQYATSSPSKEFLDNAYDLDMKVLLHCPDINVDRTNPIFNATTCEEGLEYYSDHPALLGYHVIDEPEASHMNVLSQYFNAIESYDNKILRYANLLPMYADVTRFGYPSGTPKEIAYQGYVQNFINTTNPNIVSLDGYPLLEGWPNDQFYAFDIVSNLCNQNNLDYFYVLTPLRGPSPVYCNSMASTKNVAEFNYFIFSALVYGAHGISYWSAGNCYSSWDGAISTDVMSHLRTLHKKFIASENILLSLKFKNAFHKSNASTLRTGQYESLPSYSSWSNFSTNTYAMNIFNINNPIVPLTGSKTDNIVISFLTDEFNNYYFWIFNKSLLDAEEIQLNFNGNKVVVNALDKIIYPLSSSRTVQLEPGEAKLFLVSSSYQASITICNQTFSSGNYPNAYGQEITIGGGGCIVTYENGAHVDYFAESTTINPNVNFETGCNISINGMSMGSGNLKESTLFTNNNTSSTVSEIEIFPNPNNGTFQLNIPPKIKCKNMKIYNIIGDIIYEENNISTDQYISINNIQPGTYIIELLTDSNILQHIKFIVN